MKRLLPLLCALAVFACPCLGRTEGRWIPASDAAADVNSDYTGTVTITFLGDCTLGGEEKSREKPTGFIKRIEKNGFAYPMRNLRVLTQSDDLTVANLEGVLTDRALKKVKKTYNFSGPTAFAQILTAAEIECVTLANNHSHDYGEEGYADTKAALEDAGVAWFGTDGAIIWENEEGLRIGFTGVNYALYDRQATAYEKQMRALRDAGCAALITVMHAGEEYTQNIDRHQKQIVGYAVKEGADLIVGHHPHVVQGFDFVQGVPVAYSLGNCAFGGARYVKDADALALRAELAFERGQLTGMTLRFYPITVTTDRTYNNYSPDFLTGKAAERVLNKMKKSTGYDLGGFDEKDGAVVTVSVHEK